MGQRLERELTIAQLRELSDLARAYRENDPDPGHLSTKDFLRVASQVRDPKVPVAVAGATFSCRLLY